jgi:hypothetical protein
MITSSLQKKKKKSAMVLLVLFVCILVSYIGKL